jgi:hypothetical protein
VDYLGLRNAAPITAATSQFDEVKRSATESGLSDLVRLRFSRLEADEITKLAADKMKLKAVDFEVNKAGTRRRPCGLKKVHLHN